jgi:hypothetical protein
MWSRMIYLGSFSLPKVRPYPLYTEIGRVHGGLGRAIYGLHASESRRVLQRCSMDRGGVVEPKKPWVSSSCSVLTLYMSGCIGLDWPPLGRLLESSWW